MDGTSSVAENIESVDLAGPLEESNNISIIKLDVDGNILSGGDQEPEFTATFVDGGDPQFGVMFEAAPMEGKEDHIETYSEVIQKPQEVMSQYQVIGGAIEDGKSTEFRRNLCEQMYTLQQTGVLCDVQIDLAESELPVSVHSIVLAGACRKFQDELFGGTTEEEEGSVSSIAVLGSLSLNMVNQLIRYVYTGHIDLDDCEDLDILLQCSQQLQILELEKLIEDYLNPSTQEVDGSLSEASIGVMKGGTPEKRKIGRPKKESQTKTSSGGKAAQGSPLQKDKVDSTTSQDKGTMVTKAIKKVRELAPDSKLPRGRKPKKAAQENTEEEVTDDMIVSSTNDKDLRAKNSDSEEEKVTSTREPKVKGNKKKQEIGDATKTPEIKRPRGRPKKEASQENLDSSIDETKSAKKKKKIKDTSLTEASNEGTSLSQPEGGQDLMDEEIWTEESKSVSSSRRTIKRPSWFNKDFVTAKTMEQLVKHPDVKKQKLSNETDGGQSGSPKKNLSQNSPGKFDISPVRVSLSDKLKTSSSLKTPAKNFSIEASEFLKGLSMGRGNKKGRPPGRKSESFVPVSGKKPKTIFTGFGRKRKRESSVEIEYVIINKFRSHNWKYYKPLIVGRPSVDVYDMLSHPVLKSAVTGYPNPFKIEGDLSKLIAIPSKEVKSRRKPRSKRKKVKRQGSVSSENEATLRTTDKDKDSEASPRVQTKKKTLAQRKIDKVEKKGDETDESEAVTLDMGAESTDGFNEMVTESEEAMDDSDEEFVIKSPVKKKRGRPRLAQSSLVKKKTLWKPKKPTFSSLLKKTTKTQMEKIREIKQTSRDALETGLCLILEMNYSMPRAAAAADVEVRELKQYVKDRQKEGALKRVVVRPRGNTGQQFFCMCGEQFRSINAINAHVDKYACKFGMEVFKKCGKCKLPYWDDETYLEHFDKEHPTSQVVLRCNYCPNYEVRTCRLIQLHMKYYHGISLTEFGKTTIFTCKYKNCDYETFYETCQQLHHREHAVSLFRCFKCNEQFRTYAECQEHRKTHRDTNTSRCNICEKEFEEVADFKEHMLVYHEDALVPGYTKSKGSYFEDDDPDNPSEVFVCEICEDFRTNSRNKLAAHNVAVHPKGNRDSIYPDDKMSTFEAGTTIPHASRQVGPKLNLAPFECDICEGFHGNSAVNLAVHKFREHGEDFDAKKYQLYACSHCQFSSTNHSVYLSHLDSHAGLNHKCKGCIRYFSSWDEMEEHAVIHQRGRKHYCEYINCDFSCSISGNLRKHMARHQKQCGDVIESLEEGEEVDLQMAMAVLGASSQSLIPAQPKPKTQPLRKHFSPKKRFPQVKRRGGAVEVSLLRNKARSLIAEAKQRSPMKSPTSLLENSPWQTISVLTDQDESSVDPSISTVTTRAPSGGFNISFVKMKEEDTASPAVQPASDPAFGTEAGPDTYIIQNIMDLNKDIVDLGGTVVAIDDPTSSVSDIVCKQEEGLASSSFVLADGTSTSGVVMDASMGEILGGGEGGGEGILTLTPEQMSGITITPLDYTINENGELVVMNQGEDKQE